MSKKKKFIFFMLMGVLILLLFTTFSTTVFPASTDNSGSNVNGSSFGSDDTFGTANSGSFGPQGKLNFSPEGKTFTPSTSEERKGKEKYFIHKQPLKLIMLLAFMIAGAIMVITTQYKYRKVLLVASVALLGFYMGGFLCPLTALQNVIIKRQIGYFVFFFLGLIIPALLLGRIFCGYACPFGAIQELVHVKKIRKKIPFWLEHYLGMIKYGLLLYIVVHTLISGTLIFDGYTPFKALFTLGGTPLAIGITVVVAMLSVITYRPFCNYVCPLGAFLSILSHLSLFKLKVGSTCISCGRCQKVCPTGAIQGNNNAELKVNSGKCILCGECQRKCPKESISVKIRRYFLPNQ